jgi:hypothetical protein
MEEGEEGTPDETEQLKAEEAPSLEMPELEKVKTPRRGKQMFFFYGNNEQFSDSG